MKKFTRYLVCLVGISIYAKVQPAGAPDAELTPLQILTQQCINLVTTAEKCRNNHQLVRALVRIAEFEATVIKKFSDDIDKLVIVQKAKTPTPEIENLLKHLVALQQLRQDIIEQQDKDAEKNKLLMLAVQDGVVTGIIDGL